MSALARVLKDLGHEVTGSDVKEYFFTEEALKEKNITYHNFNKKNITDEYIYISSSCYDEKHEEIKKVKENKYQFYYYHEFIAMFFEGIKIGISGTHGKTTTASIITTIFKNKKIVSIVGDSNGKAVKDYEYFIFEACEYKEHILHYNFDYLIINNIDFDHPDYFKTIEDVIKTFQKAAQKAKTLIINYDDENSKKINHPNKITFGLTENADIVGRIIESNSKGYYLEVECFKEKNTFFLQEHGLHMVYNFLAGVAVSYLNNISLNEIKENMTIYKRPLRRMQEYIFLDNIIIDDYAHHPKEIEMCINGIKQKYPSKKLVIIFQPHTYSRTLALSKEFSNVLSNASKVFLARTFTSKREKESKKQEAKVMEKLNIKTTFDDEAIREILRMRNKVILFLGAGNVDFYINVIKTINSKIEKSIPL